MPAPVHQHKCCHKHQWPPREDKPLSTYSLLSKHCTRLRHKLPEMDAKSVRLGLPRCCMAGFLASFSMLEDQLGQSSSLSCLYAVGGWHCACDRDNGITWIRYFSLSSAHYYLTVLFLLS